MRGLLIITAHFSAFSVVALILCRPKRTEPAVRGWFFSPLLTCQTLWSTPQHFAPRCDYSNLARCGPRQPEDAALEEQNWRETFNISSSSNAMTLWVGITVIHKWILSQFVAHNNDSIMIHWISKHCQTIIYSTAWYPLFIHIIVKWVN